MKTKIYAEILDDETLKQFNKCIEMEGCVQAALMPDAHLGYVAPIGSVFKFKNKISPALIGYDIGCGMSSIKLHITKDDLDLKELKNRIIELIPLGKNSFDRPQNMPELPKGTEFGERVIKNKGIYQLGTLGSGNHFIEIGEGKDNLLTIIIHSGSRNVGKQIAEHYMKMAAIEGVDKKSLEDKFDENPKNKDWFIFSMKNNDMTAYKQARDKFVKKQISKIKLIEDNFSFDLDSESGQSYFLDMNLALEFALSNRKRMLDLCIKAIKEQIPSISTSSFINRHHNHAELKDGFVIHRKGATHAEKGMLGVIPGNMRDGSFIVVGKGNEDSLSSSSHGAGRVLSRKQAKEKLTLDKFHKQMEGIETNHTDDTLDESPDAYKSIFEVMEQQKDLVDVLDYIKPILNIKG